MKNLTLITGGARSGKSKFAEELAQSGNLPVHYLATMMTIPGDSEQERRIETHRSRRPAWWRTVECASRVSEVVNRLPGGPGVVILDCLSLEITNLMLNNGGEGDPYGTETVVLEGIEQILNAVVARQDLSFVVVTNETGWSVVPDNALARAFRDFLGVANQRFAAAADNVFLMCAGLKLQLKPQSAPNSVSMFF